MKKELIAYEDPKAPVSEVFRTLRTNIQFMGANRKLSSLLITSSFIGEGKSWVASNLAITFAQAGKKVALVDADMRRGRQYTVFGVSPRPGLSNYLSGIDLEEGKNSDISNYIKKTEVENLSLIPAGNVPPNPSELLGLPKMNELLEKLGEMFDIVIIDGTPCELVTDSVILSRIVDSTVIVTAHKSTKKDALERTIKSIKNVGGNISGVVLNKVPVSAKKYSKTYYYSSTIVETKGNKIGKSFKKLKAKITGKNKKKEDEEKEENKKIEKALNNSTKTNTNKKKKHKKRK